MSTVWRADHLGHQELSGVWSAFLLRGFERHGEFQTLLDHIGAVHRPFQPAVRITTLQDVLSQRVNQEKTHESCCL